MTDATFTPDDVAPFDHGRLSQRHSTWTIAGAGAVTLGVLVGSWLVDHHANAPHPFGMDPGAARLTAAFHTPPVPALPHFPRAEPDAVAGLAVPDTSLIDPGFAHGPAPAVLAASAPLPSRFAQAEPAGAVEKPQPGPVLADVSSPIEAPAAVPATASPVSGPQIAMIVPLPGVHDEAPLPPTETVAAAEPKPQVETVPLPTPRPSLPWAAPRAISPSPPGRRAQYRHGTDASGPRTGRGGGARRQPRFPGQVLRRVPAVGFGAGLRVAGGRAVRTRRPAGRPRHPARSLHGRL